MGTSSEEPVTVPKRVEEALFYRLKARAFKECDALARAYAECCSGRVVSLVFKCRDESKALSSCMTQITGRLDALKQEWVAAGRKNEMDEDDWSELLDRAVPQRKYSDGNDPLR